MTRLAYLGADKQFSVKIIFNRGKEQTDETKPETVARSLRTSDDKIIEFRNDRFARECTFFINKSGEVEEKKGSIKIVKLQPGGAETTLLEYQINLSVHFGDKFQVAEVDLPEPEKKSEDMKGVILKKFKYRVAITPLKDKDKALYSTCVEYREKLEFVRQEDLRKKKEQKEREEQDAAVRRSTLKRTDTNGSAVLSNSNNDSFVSSTSEPR